MVEVGAGVKRLKVGDRVALEPGVPCWSNKACRWVPSSASTCFCSGLAGFCQCVAGNGCSLCCLVVWDPALPCCASAMTDSLQLWLSAPVLMDACSGVWSLLSMTAVPVLCSQPASEGHAVVQRGEVQPVPRHRVLRHAPTPRLPHAGGGLQHLHLCSSMLVAAQLLLHPAALSSRHVHVGRRGLWPVSHLWCPAASLLLP